MYFSLIFLLILIIPLLVMPKHMLAGNRTPYGIVLKAVLVIGAAVAVIFMLASTSGESLYGQMRGFVTLVSEEAAKNPAVTELLGLSEVSEEERLSMFIELYSRSMKQLPVCILLIGAITAYLEYLFLARSMEKARRSVEKMPKFREFSFPGGTAMGIMAMYLLAWVMTQTSMTADDTLYLNIDLLFDLVFSLQGISVVLMFTHLRRWPKATGIIAVIAIWITSFGQMMLVLLGLVDLMMGIKGRIRGKSAGRS